MLIRSALYPVGVVGLLMLAPLAEAKFLSVDPVTFAQDGRPGMVNRYSYALNDPINLIDPDGRCSRGGTTTEQGSTCTVTSETMGSMDSDVNNPVTAMQHYTGVGNGGAIMGVPIPRPTGGSRSTNFSKVGITDLSRGLQASVDNPAGTIGTAIDAAASSGESQSVSETFGVRTNGNSALVLGRVAVDVSGTISVDQDAGTFSMSGTVMGQTDRFDFNADRGGRSASGEAGTTLGRVTPGIPYNIHPRGSQTITFTGPLPARLQD